MSESQPTPPPPDGEGPNPDIPGSADLEPDPLEQARSSVERAVDTAQEAAGDAADAAREAARDMADAASAGLDRAEIAIQRATSGAMAPDDAMDLDTPDENERLLAILAHLSIFVLPIVGPLLILILKQPQRPFMKDQVKEALNYQITMGLLTTVGFFVFVALTLGIGLCLSPLLVLVVIPPILAAVKNAGNERYRYPLTMRLVK